MRGRTPSTATPSSPARERTASSPIRARDSPPPEGGRARGNPRPSISNFWTRGSHPWRRGAQIEPRDQVGGTARRYAGPME